MTDLEGSFSKKVYYESTKIQTLPSPETSLLKNTYTVPEASFAISFLFFSISLFFTFGLFQISAFAKSKLMNHRSYALINHIRGDFETLCVCCGAEINQLYSANAACNRHPIEWLID